MDFDLRTGAVKSKEMRPEQYSMEANQKASGRVTFVSQVGMLLFQEQWKILCSVTGEDLPGTSEVAATMDNCIQVADLWRRKLNDYHVAQAESVHAEVVEAGKRAGIVVPTWGEIREHYPNGMFAGPQHG